MSVLCFSEPRAQSQYKSLCAQFVWEGEPTGTQLLKPIWSSTSKFWILPTGNMSDEIAFIEKTLAECGTFPGTKSVLQQYLVGLKRSVNQAAPSSTAASAALPTSSPPKTTAPPATPSVFRAAPSSGAKYVNLDDISWDQGTGIDTPTLSVYVGLPGVGKVKDNVDVKFGPCSIDLIVNDLDGKSYRYVQTNLEKDIIPAECKVLVKANKIILKLAKVKGQYSYESWQNLVAKKKRDPEEEKKKKADPSGGIMDMMKNLYDEGDDGMKKVIGEAMLKSRSGEKQDPPEMPDMPSMPDMSSMKGLGKM